MTFDATSVAMNAETDMETRMKIVIEEDELKEIIADYLREQMPERSGENFDVKFTAGRGPQGHYAEIEVSKRDIATTTDNDEEEKTEDLTDAPAVDPFS